VSDGEKALLTKATAAIAAKNWQEAERVLKQLSAKAPARWEYQKSLGDAEGNLAHYPDAVASYDKAILLAEKSLANANGDRAKAIAALPTMYMAKGNMFLKLKQNNNAVATYFRAAALSPNPAMTYFTICATLYNANVIKYVVEACDKAITADPKKADAYFVKGSALFGEGKLDKSGKYVVSAAAIQALQKYLTLAPNGGHAADVKEMLVAIKPAH